MPHIQRHMPHSKTQRVYMRPLHDHRKLPQFTYPFLFETAVSTINDNCLTPMAQDPTRENNIHVLDLFLTNNPTLVDSVSVTPGMSDHDAVISVIKLRPSIQKMKPRTIQIYSKADWEGMRHDMQKFQSSFLSTCEGKSTEQLWQEFTAEIDQIVKKYVPSKTLRGRKNLPWVTQEIRRKMNHRDHLYQVQKKIWEGRRPTKVQKVSMK